MDKEQIYTDLLQLTKNAKILLDEQMCKHTSLKIGGNADVFVKAESDQDVKKIIEYAKNNDIPLTVIGNGSNILVKDKGIRGITLQIGLDNIKIENYEIEENKRNIIDNQDVIIDVEAGVKLGILSAILQKNGISGFEFASGIPGTIGGSIRMNAGAYGKEFKDIVDSITYIDDNMNIKTISGNEAKFSYRHSRFVEEKNNIIISTKLKLKRGNSNQIKQNIEEYRKSRMEKQPTNFPSAGSTFKRGEDFITAKLIDEAGLKGYKIGGAQVSTKHAGFIVNTGDATAQDVLELVTYIKEKIKEKFDKEIYLEIEVIGE